MAIVLLGLIFRLAYHKVTFLSLFIFDICKNVSYWLMILPYFPYSFVPNCKGDRLNELEDFPPNVQFDSLPRTIPPPPLTIMHKRVVHDVKLLQVISTKT